MTMPPRPPSHWFTLAVILILVVVLAFLLEAVIEQVAR